MNAIEFLEFLSDNFPLKLSDTAAESLAWLERTYPDTMGSTTEVEISHGQ